MFDILSESELAEIDELQAAQQKEWKAIAAAGHGVDFAGIDLLVMPGVFPPRDDTRLLVEHLRFEAGSEVLDLGTGTGALAVWAARNGASRVVATDIAGAATYNARQNVERLDLHESIEVRNGNMFACIGRSESFPVILANLPARNKVASDDTAAAQWDTEFRAHRALFEGAPLHLSEGGCIYMAKANYPELLATLELAVSKGFETEVIGECGPSLDDPRIYYALRFSLRQRR